ncbi:hypothetical protein CU254_14820 [Amycolatopsis sp. AA4]|uniref:hypothetical protein n=1 Tax=Actinomycetes TaxID=1760 RepID=UPI0002E7919D|nr:MULTISPECIES: hypothetical protein [Actinomycetes]ATY16370.1 hypothetical protein CU254_14820 [Amycolatopsis sp. AA4]
MTGRVFRTGDPEPPNNEVRQVRGASGAVYGRSPGGLHWFLRGGGVSPLRHWPVLLAHDGPLTAGAAPPQLVLFDLPGAS